MLLINKYQPEELKDIIGLDSIIKELAKKGDIPSLIFYGPAGTGKTTTARVLSKPFNSIKINASDDRGIDAIRERVKNYASTKSIGTGKKIIILDEADGLTPQAQEILRGVMDSYSNNCSFILTCNFYNKLIDPLKSRCVCIEFKQPDKTDILGYVGRICEKENIKFTQSALAKIIDTTYPDIRRCLKEIESIYIKFKEITEDTVLNSLNKFVELFSYISDANPSEACKLYEEERLDEEEMMEYLADKIFFSGIDIEKKRKAISLISTAYMNMSRVITKRIIIRPFIYGLSEVLK